MTKPRDYKAEYQRRKALGKTRGLTTAQARGHARASQGEKSVAEIKQADFLPRIRLSTEQRFYAAAQQLQHGKSLTQAARDAGLSTSTLRRLNRQKAVFAPGETRGQWLLKSHSRGGIYTQGQEYQFIEVDKQYASLLARYENAIKAALYGDDQRLKDFEGVQILDISGQSYRLTGDIDLIVELRQELEGTEADKREFSSGQRSVRSYGGI